MTWRCASLDNLEKHQKTLNPKIKKSSVWTLVSPLIEYFESGAFCPYEEEGELILSIELQHRRDAYDSLVGHLEAIPEPDHTNRDIQVYNTRRYRHEPNWLYRTVSAHWICMNSFLNQISSIQDAMKSHALASLSLPLPSGTKGIGLNTPTSIDWWMRNSWHMRSRRSVSLYRELSITIL